MVPEFQEIYDAAARRVSHGKHSKNAIRFYLTNGQCQKFDLPPFNDQMLDDFIATTCRAINNHEVDRIVINFEGWYLEPKNLADSSQEAVDQYLLQNPRPRDHPERKEGLFIYCEKSDGETHIFRAEIRSVNKKKRVLDGLEDLGPSDGKMLGRVGNFFEKARSAEYKASSLIESIIRRN